MEHNVVYGYDIVFSYECLVHFESLYGLESLVLTFNFLEIMLLLSLLVFAGWVAGDSSCSSALRVIGDSSCSFSVSGHW